MAELLLVLLVMAIILLTGLFPDSLLFSSPMVKYVSQCSFFSPSFSENRPPKLQWGLHKESGEPTVQPLSVLLPNDGLMEPGMEWHFPAPLLGWNSVNGWRLGILGQDTEDQCLFWILVSFGMLCPLADWWNMFKVWVQGYLFVYLKCRDVWINLNLKKNA